MDVSIIVVSYNTCALLRNCLRSVQAQTRRVAYQAAKTRFGYVLSFDESAIRKEIQSVCVSLQKAKMGSGADIPPGF